MSDNNERQGAAVADVGGLTPERIEAIYHQLEGRAIIQGENQMNWNAAVRKSFARAVEHEVLATTRTAESLATKAAPDRATVLDLARKAGFGASDNFIMPPPHAGHITEEVENLIHLATQAGGGPVAFADPMAFANFKAAAYTKEWMWAKPDAGLVPLYTHAAPASLPEGWKLVPAEPTREMIDAAQEVDTEGEDDTLAALAIMYSTMLAAAPVPPIAAPAVQEAVTSRPEQACEHSYRQDRGGPNDDLVYRCSKCGAYHAEGATPSVQAVSSDALQQAVDAAYPIPDSPHGSVIVRNGEDRAAFRRGYIAGNSAKAGAVSSDAGERERFEAWLGSCNFLKFSDGSYVNNDINKAWGAWQARAALTTYAGAPTAPEARIAELEAARCAYASEFPLNADGEPDVGSIHANIRALKAQIAAPTAADYESVLAGHRQLVRELDVLLNGKDGAAKQASLVDIVSQVRREGIKAAPASAQDQVVRKGD